MGEWFRGKDKRKISDSGENAPAGTDANDAPEGGKAESSPDTEGSSAVKDAETVANEEDVKGARTGEGGESAALEGAKGVVEELGGDGDDSGKRSSAILSDEEVEKLRDEQDAKYKELEVNVNVFMPYKVGNVVGGDRKRGWVL